MFPNEFTSSLSFSSSSVFYMDSFTCQSCRLSPPPWWDMLYGTLDSLSHSTMLQIMKTVRFTEKANSAPAKSVTYSGLWQHDRWVTGDGLFRIFTSSIDYSLILLCCCPTETATWAGRGPSVRWVRGDGSWWGRRRCPATSAPRHGDLSSKGWSRKLGTGMRVKTLQLWLKHVSYKNKTVPTRSCLPPSHLQSPQTSGFQTKTEAFSEFWGVKRQQHQTDSSGVVPLKDYWLPGKTIANKLLDATTANVNMYIVNSAVRAPS